MKFESDPTLVRKAQLKPTTDLMAPPSFVLPDVTDVSWVDIQATEFMMRPTSYKS